MPSDELPHTPYVLSYSQLSLAHPSVDLRCHGVGGGNGGGDGGGDGGGGGEPEEERAALATVDSSTSNSTAAADNALLHKGQVSAGKVSSKNFLACCCHN